MNPSRVPCLWLALVVIAGACGDIHDASVPGNLVPRTVDEDPALPAVDLAGTRLHLQTFGDPTKPVLVFQHGGPGGDYRDLLRLAERRAGYALTDDYFLVYWDQRGSGLSRREDCEVFTLERIDADLDAVIERYSPGRPVLLIGHSWGAMYTTLYVNRHPEKVAGAVLIEPGPLDGRTYEEMKKDLRDLNVFSEWLNDYVWAATFISADDHARADYNMMLGVHDSEPRFGKRMDVDPAPVWRLGAIANRCITKTGIRDGKADYDFTDHLAAFGKPVLFLAGDKDEVEGPSFQEKQRQRFPMSSLITIPGAGHDLAWTHPDETLAAIRTYFRGLP